MSVDKIIDAIIKAEGGYSDDKSDLGGKTKYGITESVARANGYYGDMRDLPESFARQVYKNKYWFEPKFDKVATLSEAVAEELTDTGVNCGVSFAKPLLQEALNLLNRQQADYKDLAVDGNIGPATLGALGSYLMKRGKEGEAVLVRVLNIMQGARYIEISKVRAANEDFFYGWIKNRVVI
jgi:lysozyme family protein